jgi:hypothetical protein
MLAEFKDLSQEKEGFRRLFTDRHFDLYLWYESRRGPLTGFQLCYDLGGDPHSLTVKVGGSSVHARIDEGEDGCMRYKGSPILVSDGVFEREDLLERFAESSASLEPRLREMVIEAIRAYPEGG